MTNKPTDAQIEAAEIAVMLSERCGYTLNKERVFCDDARLPKDHYMEVCDCKKAARAALKAAALVEETKNETNKS